MSEHTWDDVDHFLEERLLGEDAALSGALRAQQDGGLPSIAVSPTQGKLLHLLALSIGARTILEVGTLGGYSAIWLARALPAGGRLVTCEIDPHHAEVARSSIAAAGLADRVEVRVGRGVDTLAALQAEGFGPVDLTFVDADKPSNADYVAAAVEMSRPGALVIVDNVVRAGAVADRDSDDANVQGVHRVLDLIASDPRLDATAIQTVGVKGYDGFLLARVRAD